MTPTEPTTWPLLAYGDRLSLAPGDELGVMVSSLPATFDAELVRLGVADGSGRERPVPSTADGTYPGRIQALRTGSYVRTAPLPRVVGRSFTVQAWVCPTLPGARVQTILAAGGTGAAGWALELDEAGHPRLREWSAGAETLHVRGALPLARHTWYFVAAVVDRQRGRARLRVEDVSRWPAVDRAVGEGVANPSAAGGAADPQPVFVAARPDADDHGPAGVDTFNGKIEAPRLFTAALTPAQLKQLRDGADPLLVAPDALGGAWDFTVGMDSVVVRDRSAAGADGICVNMPTRAVTGHRWRGQVLDPAEDPSLYGAIHFHDDDLEDAGWERDLAVPIAADLASGLYAVKLSSGEDCAYVPFFVRAPRDRPASDVLFLAPTNTYMAYGNDRLAGGDANEQGAGEAEAAALRPIDRFLTTHPELGGSLYDTHRDGSGICHVSRLRPIPNVDPTYVNSLTGAPRHFAADVQLLAWLDGQGLQVDVATDEDLHRDGAELLSRYRVVLTGSHPEYSTGAMLDGLEGYLEQGGHLMYLGGNGFYWVTTFHRERPHVIELRRGFAGTRNWQVAPGEEHHSTTGERGGLWRHRGRSAHALVGVGTTGHGLVDGVGYRRLPASHDERLRFIFDGVEGEAFGGSGLCLGGAAGDEVDATDAALGTPSHAVVLARSEPLSGYVPMMEDELWYRTDRTGEHNPTIRSELVWFETGHGGAVFSTGSVNWCGALGVDGGDNDVSRITRNVLDAFRS